MRFGLRGRGRLSNREVQEEPPQRHPPRPARRYATPTFKSARVRMRGSGSSSDRSKELISGLFGPLHISAG